jgi:hypothetical protein
MGSGSGSFRYNSDEVSTNYTTVLGTGLYAIYREQPAIMANQSMVYGDAVPTLPSPLTASNGDTASDLILNSTVNSTSGHLIVGSYSITSSTLAALGYAGSTLNVTPKALTAAFTGVSKTYDRTVTATASASSDDRLTNDVLTVVHTGATFADKNVGTGKTVSVTGVSLTGTDAGNYTVAATGSTTADLTPRTLNVTYTGVNKVYDGALSATVTTSDDHISGDTFTIERSAAFADKNAATGKTISVSGVSLSGTDADNYTVATTGTASADITPRLLNLSYTGVNKVYDGLTTATVTTSDDRVDGDNLTIQRTANFLDANVAPAKPILVNGVALAGTDAGNYILASTTGTASADIGQDASLDAALRAPQQMPLPQPTVPPVLMTQMQAPADRTPLDGIGGLKMVPVNSDPVPAASSSEGRGATGAPSSAATVPAAGLDPYGYVRVFVVRGGLNLPTEALTVSDKPAQPGLPR